MSTDQVVPCDHEAWEVQLDGSGICVDCGEEVGGIGSNDIEDDNS